MDDLAVVASPTSPDLAEASKKIRINRNQALILLCPRAR